MVRRTPLAAFFAPTFAITWGVGLLAVLAPRTAATARRRAGKND